MIRKHLKDIFIAAVLGMSVMSIPQEAQSQDYAEQFCHVGHVTKVGTASWYGAHFHGRRTANGERFNQRAMTAAHKTLPLGSFIKVVNQDNGRELVVRINDRGPYVKGRVLDLSRGAAEKLGFDDQGVTTVSYSPCS